MAVRRVDVVAAAVMLLLAWVPRPSEAVDVCRNPPQVAPPAGKEWFLVTGQDARGGQVNWPTELDPEGSGRTIPVATLNAGNPSADGFSDPSIVAAVPASGQPYDFVLEFPSEHDTMYNRWTQTTDPFTYERDTALDVTFLVNAFPGNDAHRHGGICRSNDFKHSSNVGPHEGALLDGNCKPINEEDPQHGTGWFYALGTTNDAWSGTQWPGPRNFGNSLTTAAELWLAVPVGVLPSQGWLVDASGAGEVGTCGAVPPDTDGDGDPDSTDPDIDGDGFNNDVDAHPYDSSKVAPDCAPDCADGEACFGDHAVCASGVCDTSSGGACQAPTCVDGVRNGDEVAVDAGGAACSAPACSESHGAAVPNRAVIYVASTGQYALSAAACRPGLDDAVCDGTPDFRVGSASYYVVDVAQVGWADDVCASAD